MTNPTFRKYFKDLCFSATVIAYRRGGTAKYERVREWYLTRYYGPAD